MKKNRAGPAPVSTPVAISPEISYKYEDAPVAQLDRATDSGSVGRAFESRQAYFLSEKGMGLYKKRGGDFYRLPFVFSSTQNEYLTPSLKILGSVKAVASPNWTM